MESWASRGRTAKLREAPEEVPMAAQDETLTSDMVAKAAQANWLFDRLPDWVVR